MKEEKNPIIHYLQGILIMSQELEVQCWQSAKRVNSMREDCMKNFSEGLDEILTPINCYWGEGGPS